MTTPLAPIPILRKHGLLDPNQYYHAKHKKSRICGHHTSGGTAQSSIDWWNLKPDHVGTPILILRNGEIWELFDTSFWAYTGLNGTWLEKSSVQFEICSYGGLVKSKDGRFYSWSGKVIPANKVVTYKRKHRGYKYFEKYTDKQVRAIVYVIDYYAKLHNIKIVPADLEKFWWTGKPKALFSHTTVRRDKSDIHPQPNLIKAIYNHFGCTAPVTE